MGVSDTERNKSVLRRMLEAADSGDLDAVAACYATDYVDHAEGGSRSTGDRAGALETFEELRQAFPDTRHTIEDLIADDDRVVLRVSVSGTHQADFRGIAATGRAVSMTQTAIYRFRDGLIAERWLHGSESVAGRLRREGATGEPSVRSAPARSPRLIRARDAAWELDASGASFWILQLRDLALTCFRLDPGTRFPQHSHEAEQITMVLEGQLAFEIGDRRYDVGPGDAIAIPSGVAHAVVAGREPVLAMDAWSPPPEHLGTPGVR